MVYFHQKMNGTLLITSRPLSRNRAIRYSGLGVRSVGPVGEFLNNPYVIG